MPENDKIHILFASRLVWEKGVDILIAAIEATLEHEVFSEKIIWHICGKGTHEAEIFFLEKKFPGKILYHWLLSQQWLATLYRQADVLFMPSRFLETFWLTALESLASGTPIIGIRKWGLTPFIHKDLAIDESSPIPSFLHILEMFWDTTMPLIPVRKYGKKQWLREFRELINPIGKTLLVHDYRETIGWAEIYLSQLEDAFRDEGLEYLRYSYNKSTTPLKRKLLFLFSAFDISRFFSLYVYTYRKKIKTIWVHSFLRYIWYWWLLGLIKIRKKNMAKLYISHHDLGLIAPFPQDITSEEDIPLNTTKEAFIAGLSWLKKYVALAKWQYIQFLKKLLPRATTHVIFSPFLEGYIKNHFPWHKVIIFPHFYDDELFHP